MQVAQAAIPLTESVGIAPFKEDADEALHYVPRKKAYSDHNDTAKAEMKDMRASLVNFLDRA